MLSSREKSSGNKLALLHILSVVLKLNRSVDQELLDIAFHGSPFCLIGAFKSLYCMRVIYINYS